MRNGWSKKDSHAVPTTGAFHSRGPLGLKYRQCQEWWKKGNSLKRLLEEGMKEEAGPETRVDSKEDWWQVWGAGRAPAEIRVPPSRLSPGLGPQPGAGREREAGR